MLESKNRFKHIVADNRKTKNNNVSKIVSVLLFVLAIVYLILPYDFDKGIVGKVDDFFFFMAAFCNMYANFLEENKLRIILLLKVISGAFCVVGALCLVLLAIFLKWYFSKINLKYLFKGVKWKIMSEWVA